jgi:hypothetical protein
VISVVRNELRDQDENGKGLSKIATSEPQRRLTRSRYSTADKLIVRPQLGWQSGSFQGPAFLAPCSAWHS